MALPFVLLLLATGLERLVELVISRRNAAWSRSRGAVEVGVGHWPVMVALHLFLLVAPALEVTYFARPFVPQVGYAMLGLTLAAQALRYWCIVTLGRHWNVRVFVVPGAPAVARGPYRWLRHPNYLAVVLEGACLPLVQGAVISCAAFTVANFVLLRRRVQVEQAALASLSTGYDRVGQGASS